MKTSPATAVILVFIGFLVSGTAAADDWTTRARYELGGDGGWDLMSVDAATHRVFIARSTRVMAVDLDRGTLVGEVGGLDHAHGVAVDERRRRGYATSGGDDRVIVFDLDSLAVVGRIATTGHNPDAAVLDDASGRVLVFNGHSNSADVIDPAGDRIVATIALPGKPELAAADGRGKVFVNLEDKGQIAEIDARRANVVATWPLADCEEPSGLAIDRKHERLFSVCANRKMAIVDARRGRVVATMPIGEHPDGCAFDPESADAFSPNSDGTLTIVHENDPDHFSVAATVSTPMRARTITLDARTHRVVLAFADFDAAPPPTAADPHPRPPMKPGSFGIIAVGRH